MIPVSTMPTVTAMPLVFAVVAVVPIVMITMVALVAMIFVVVFLLVRGVLVPCTHDPHYIPPGGIYKWCRDMSSDHEKIGP